MNLIVFTTISLLLPFTNIRNLQSNKILLFLCLKMAIEILYSTFFPTMTIILSNNLFLVH